jgi:hypothetical protein
MNDRKAQIRILQNTISFQEQHLKDLEERCAAKLRGGRLLNLNK